MKYGLTLSIFIILFSCFVLTYSGIKREELYTQDYKRALDAGTDAAAKAITYLSAEDLNDLGNGFGTGINDTNSIPVNKENSLTWFYRVLFSNLNIENNIESQNAIKKYIPLKAIIAFEGIWIADVNDNWSFYDFKINLNNKEYKLTLSNQVYDITTNKWITIAHIGISDLNRYEKIAAIIKEKIEYHLNHRQNTQSNNYYTFNIANSNLDLRLKGIEGNNFIVFCEGLPIPSLNWFSATDKYYAFSVGGSELSRKK